MQIREARDGDLDAICALLEAAFNQPDEARLVGELWDSDDLAAVLVAVPDGDGGGDVEDHHADRRKLDGGAGGPSGSDADDDAAGSGPDHAIAGVAVLSHLSSPSGCLALGPLAVAPDRSDRGIGKALIAEGVDWARRAGHAGIFVLGQPPYYERFGFSVEAARPFASPYPAEYMLALELRPGALADGGELRYPVAFAALG